MTDSKRDALIEYLTVAGADKTPHVRGSLLDHLTTTYDLLRAANQSETICLAGGAHSVYGTYVFSDAIAEHDDQTVKSIIGDDAYEIVRLFATIKRPLSIERTAGKNPGVLPLIDGGLVSVTAKQFYSLFVIECANLYEQKDIHEFERNFPNLFRFWAKIYKNKGN